MADIILKKRSGAKVEHDGIRVLQVPKADGTIEEYISPTGNINITDTQITDVRGKATAQVVDANLVAENIAKGVSVLGITGTHEGGGGEFPQLHAPTISISEDTLTITNPSNNGDFVTGYKIYVDGELHSTVTATTVDLSGVTETTASITVKCSGNLFADSTDSNAETLRAQYTITFYDGDTVLSSSSVGYGLTPTVPSTTKQGYTFDYWCSDSTLTTEITVGEVTGNTNYYGKWSEALWASLIQSPSTPYSGNHIGAYYSDTGNALAVLYFANNYTNISFYDTTTNPYTLKATNQLTDLDYFTSNIVWYTIESGSLQGTELAFCFGKRKNDYVNSLCVFKSDGTSFYSYVPTIPNSKSYGASAYINKTTKKLLLISCSTTAYIVDLSGFENSETCTYETITLPYSNGSSNFPQSAYLLDDGRILHIITNYLRTYEIVDGAYVENAELRIQFRALNYNNGLRYHASLDNGTTNLTVAYSYPYNSNNYIHGMTYDVSNTASYSVVKQIYYDLKISSSYETFGFALSPDNHIVSGYGNPGVLTVKEYETDTEIQTLEFTGGIYSSNNYRSMQQRIAISNDCKKMTILSKSSPYLYCYSITPTN